MVVCEDLKLKAQREIEAFKVEKASIAKSLRSLGAPFDAEIIERYPDAKDDSETDAGTLAARN